MPALTDKDVPDLINLLDACDGIAPWMAAAISDPNACEEFKREARKFVESHENLRNADKPRH